MSLDINSTNYLTVRRLWSILSSFKTKIATALGGKSDANAVVAIADATVARSSATEWFMVASHTYSNTDGFVWNATWLATINVANSAGVPIGGVPFFLKFAARLSNSSTAPSASEMSFTSSPVDSSMKSLINGIKFKMVFDIADGAVTAKLYYSPRAAYRLLALREIMGTISNPKKTKERWVYTSYGSSDTGDSTEPTGNASITMDWVYSSPTSIRLTSDDNLDYVKGLGGIGTVTGYHWRSQSAPSNRPMSPENYAAEMLVYYTDDNYAMQVVYRSASGIWMRKLKNGEWDSSWAKIVTTADITTGTDNGTISVAGSDVAVKGLGGAAYLNTGTASGTVATGNHTHGNITNGGALQTNDITIANGDKLVVTDADNSNKVARTSVSFDGSTTTKALTPKGTWEPFAKRYSLYYGDGAKYKVLASVPNTSTDSGTEWSMLLSVRFGQASAFGILQGHSDIRCSWLFTAGTLSATVLFYTAADPNDNKRTLIIAYVPNYHRINATSFCQDTDVDFSVWDTDEPEGTTHTSTNLIKTEQVAQSAESSGTAPVKVDDHGELVAVPMDTEPTADSTNLMTSGSIKTALDGKANLNSYGYIATSNIPVIQYRASSASTLRICRVPSPNTSTMSVLECNVRWAGTYARIIIQSRGWVANVIGASLESYGLAFYRQAVTVDNTTYYDIIAVIPSYCRCVFAASFLWYNSNLDFSVYGNVEYTPVAADKITYSYSAQALDSSGTAPVKVDALGNLSAVTMDTEPTADSTNLMTSGSIKTELDKKVAKADVRIYTQTSDTQYYKIAECNAPADYTNASLSLDYWIARATAKSERGTVEISARPKNDSSYGINHFAAYQQKKAGSVNYGLSFILTMATVGETVHMELWASLAQTYVGLFASGRFSKQNNRNDGTSIWSFIENPEATATAPTQPSGGLIATATPSFDVTVASTSAVGSGTEPVYVDANGDVQACTGGALHTHSNKAVIDGISSSDVTNWNGKADAVSITQGTYPKMTVNSQGIVTAGSSLASSDIPVGNVYDNMKAFEGTVTPWLVYEITGIGLTTDSRYATAEFIVYQYGSSVTENLSYKVNVHWARVGATVEVEGPDIGTAEWTAVVVNSETPASTDVTTLKLYCKPNSYRTYRVSVLSCKRRGTNSNVIDGSITKKNTIEEIPTASSLVLIGTTTVNGHYSKFLAVADAVARANNKSDYWCKLAEYTFTGTKGSFCSSWLVTFLTSSGAMPSESFFLNFAVRANDSGDAPTKRIFQTSIINTPSDTNNRRFKMVVDGSSGNLTMKLYYFNGASNYCSVSLKEVNAASQSNASSIKNTWTYTSYGSGSGETTEPVGTAANWDCDFVYASSLEVAKAKDYDTTSGTINTALDGKVSKSGDTMTGLLTITRDDNAISISHGTANKYAGIQIQRTDTSTQMSVGISASNGNTHGIYSNKYTKWIVCADANGLVHLNQGNSTANVRLGNTDVGSPAQPVYIDDGQITACTMSSLSVGTSTTATNANNAKVTTKTDGQIYLAGALASGYSTGGNAALYTDTGIYATATSGQLHATTFDVNSKCTLQFNTTTNALDFVFI